MDTLIDFISFKDPNVVYVVLGMLFINSSSALIGTFAFLRKRSLIGDAVAHSLLPGLCLGFMWSGEKQMVSLLFGAFISGWLSTYAVDVIVNRSKIKQDAAIGIVLSTFFAIGIVLLTFIQQSSSGQQGGLDHFLFGQAAAINRSDVFVFGAVLSLILITVLLFYRPFVMISFNPDFARSVGLPVRFIAFLLTSLTVLSIAAGIQALGVILMSALIITPAATARFWTHKLKIILILSVLFSVFSGLSGAFISYAQSGMPTGPWVVMFLSILVAVSILFAPNRGILSKIRRKRMNKRKILHENILKAMFKFHEDAQHADFTDTINIHQMMSKRNFDTTNLMNGLRGLIRKGFVVRSGEHFALTTEGVKESKRVNRLHRLWEQYLIHKASMKTDHVHAGAEAIEHIITPEIEAELETELGISGLPKEDY